MGMVGYYLIYMCTEEILVDCGCDGGLAAKPNFPPTSRLFLSSHLLLMGL